MIGRTLLQASLLVLILAAHAMAHDYWIVARPAMVKPGETVTIEICGGHQFPVSEFAVAVRLLHKLEITSPDGGVSGYLPEVAGKSLFAEWTPDQPGVYQIAFQLRRPREEKTLAFASALVVVGGNEFPAIRPRGQELEVVPALVDGKLEVSVFSSGKPIKADVGFGREHVRQVYRTAYPDRPASFTSAGSGLHMMIARRGSQSAALTIYIPE
ncbi:MAG TPA: DUF4198 domain-containing protein [Kiritimatiellia bacterium]|nr:DUF4198 domain-containing protein [Kiritimatiellia bacterium]